MRIRPKMKVYTGDYAKYAHVKYDGHYIEVIKSASGLVTCKSSQDIELPLDFVPDLLNVWIKAPECHILGELWYPDEPASYVKTAIKNRDKRLKFSLFAVLDLDTLEDTSDFAVKNGLEMVPFYVNTGHAARWCTHRLGSFDHASDLQITHEGFVMKDNAWDNWRKLKPFKSIDLIITGVVPGKGKYDGLVGALVASTYEGHEVANVAGFTDDERLLLSESDIGKVIEVKYQLVGSGGRLRHPNFLRFREDKLPEDCTLEQDGDLYDQYTRRG